MQDVKNESEKLLNEIQSTLKTKISSFKNLGSLYADYLPGAKQTKVKQHEQIILKETFKYLQSVKEKISPLERQVEDKISKKIYPLRTSSIASNIMAGQAQFSSGLSLVQSKNLNLIKSELKSSLSNPSLTDHAYSVFNIIRHTPELPDSFKDEIGTMFNSHPLSQDYADAESVKSTLNEIQNQVKYYSRAVDNGKLDSNYAINRQIRK